MCVGVDVRKCAYVCTCMCTEGVWTCSIWNQFISSTCLYSSGSFSITPSCWQHRPENGWQELNVSELDQQRRYSVWYGPCHSMTLGSGTQWDLDSKDSWATFLPTRITASLNYLWCPFIINIIPLFSDPKKCHQHIFTNYRNWIIKCRHALHVAEGGIVLWVMGERR